MAALLKKRALAEYTSQVLQVSDIRRIITDLKQKVCILSIRYVGRNVFDLKFSVKIKIIAKTNDSKW